MPLNFNGLSIILNKPSRFDLKNNKLLSAPSGAWFANELRKNHIDITNCHITTANDNNLPKDTRNILLLGDESLALFKPEVSLGEQRGAPFSIELPTGNINIIASFTPQDSFDPRNYEATHNPLNNKLLYANETDTASENEVTTKSHGKTNRSNYKFWLSKDIEKISRIHNTGKVNVIAPEFYIAPPGEEIIAELLKHKNEDFTIDIETNPETCDITVLSFCFTDKNNSTEKPVVWIVPINKYNYTKHYGEKTYKIFAAISIAMRDNTTVTHNGSGYDLFILTYKYRLPFGINQFDTMLSHQRNFPEQEKSLGHVLSLYTDFPYHKNTAGTYVPFNTTQEYNLWIYNGTDVHATLYAKRGILTYANKIKSTESIQQINRSIYPYLLMTFTGMWIDESGINNKLDENDKLIIQYLRILKFLIGKEINPRSPKQMAEYLYAKRSKGGLGLEPHYSKEHNLSSDAPTLIKLILKHPEIVSIRVILAIRNIQDESKALIFKPLFKL